MLTGAVIGFCLGIALGFAGRAEWPTMLWRACAAAVVLGWLMLWWGRTWVRGFRASLEQRRAIEATARQQQSASTHLKK